MFAFSKQGTLPGKHLDDDLDAHNARYGGTRGLTFEITFPDAFPEAPPVVFLRHPILVDGTGVRLVWRDGAVLMVLRVCCVVAMHGGAMPVLSLVDDLVRAACAHDHVTDANDRSQNVIAGVPVIPALVQEGWDHHYSMKRVSTRCTVFVAAAFVAVAAAGSSLRHGCGSYPVPCCVAGW